MGRGGGDTQHPTIPGGPNAHTTPQQALPGPKEWAINGDLSVVGAFSQFLMCLTALFLYLGSYTPLGTTAHCVGCGVFSLIAYVSRHKTEPPRHKTNKSWSAKTDQSPAGLSGFRLLQTDYPVYRRSRDNPDGIRLINAYGRLFCQKINFNSVQCANPN